MSSSWKHSMTENSTFCKLHPSLPCIPLGDHSLSEAKFGTFCSVVPNTNCFLWI